MYDTVRVHFTNDTSTVLHVNEDDDIVIAIMELCNRKGWSLNSILRWGITGQVNDEYEATGQLEDR